MQHKYVKKKRITLPVIALLAVFLFCITSCNTTNSQTETPKQELTEHAKQDTIVVPKLITYHQDSIANAEDLKEFKSKYDSAQLKTIAAINRIDVFRIRAGSSLIIPDTFYTDFKFYTPFPEHLNIPDSIPKFIFVQLRIQLFAAYENGNLVRVGPISSGRKSKQTPQKLYYTNYKSKRKISTVDGSWIMPWYFNISNNGGIGLHQYALPGYPASHSCVRMYEENARWIFDWAQQWILTSNQTQILVNGTPVLVYGDYDFSQPSPWKQLPKNPHILELLPEELQTMQAAISKAKIHP